MINPSQSAGRRAAEEADDGEMRCWALYRLCQSPHRWVWLAGPPAGRSIRRTAQPSRDAMVASFTPGALHLPSSPLFCFPDLHTSFMSEFSEGFLSPRLSSPSRDGLDPDARTSSTHIQHIHPNTPRCSVTGSLTYRFSVWSRAPRIAACPADLIAIS